MPVQLGRPVRLYGGFFPFFVPGSPTSVQAFPGAAQALVSWTAPALNGGTPITGYRVTASPGGAQISTASATVATVTGLTNGTSYTFTVTAINAAGASPSSVASSAVTPVDIPTAPTGVRGTAGDTQVVVAWSAPSTNNGSAITGYTVTASPGGAHATTTGALTATVTGLTDGTSYTFTVTATNGVGTSPASSASAAITPIAASGQPGPTSAGAPAIPDGVWPMGYAGYSKGILNAGYTGGATGLKVLNRDWNFSTDGLDLSGWNIQGKVVLNGTNNVVGDGFYISGATGGTSANALLDMNCHFTGTKPNLKNFTIKPTAPVQGTNGWMGDEATLFNVEIANVGGDALSPNNLHNSEAPLNFTCDWFYFHDLVYYYPDSGHTNGTHNDGMEINGGTNLTLTRGYITGITHPTLGQGAFLRNPGPSDGPRPLGQQNSAIITIQSVSPVGNITIDHCHLGGGWFGTVNVQSIGSSTQLGPFTITNCIFDGNDLDGYDLIIHSNTNVIQSGNKRANGSAISILNSSTPD